MSLVVKLISFYSIVNCLGYVMSTVLSDEFVVNNVSQTFKINILYKYQESTDSLLPSLLTMTSTEEVSERQWYGEPNVANGVIISPTMTKTHKNLNDFTKSLDQMYNQPSSMLQFKDSSNNTNKETIASLAESHYRRMLQETACKTPKPKIIRVKDLYPDPHKTYYPVCTILYRCSEGCCIETKRCMAYKTNNVTLYFKVRQLTKEDKVKDSSIGHEALSFINHTECRCQTTEETMPRDTESDAVILMPHDIRHKHHFDHSPTKVQHQRCKCPGPYAVHYGGDGICTCNCVENKVDCINFAIGNMYFNKVDRYCITTGSCLIPPCLYGIYHTTIGRCPKKDEKYNFREDNLQNDA